MTSTRSDARPFTWVLLTALLALLTACSTGLSQPAGSGSTQPTTTQQSTTASASAAPTAATSGLPGTEASSPELGSDSSTDAVLGLTDALGMAGSETSATSAAPVRLAVPSADIDVDILGLTPTAGEVSSQSIVPPFTLDAYWLTSYGAPGEGSTNTTYITGHSWEDQDAPFNRLSTHAVVGQPLTVTTEAGVLDYVIESVTTHDKNTLSTSDIWDIVPHRVVIISCYTDDLWGKNVIVTAVPA